MDLVKALNSQYMKEELLSATPRNRAYDWALSPVSTAIGEYLHGAFFPCILPTLP